MKKMSTGQDSTLGNWYGLCSGIFGPDSKATLFIKKKMDEQGPDEEVIADERQLLYLLGQMFVNEHEGNTTKESNSF